MPASYLIAAPDSTTAMRQAANLVVDPAKGDPAAQVNALLAAAGMCRVAWAAGTYGLLSGVVRRTAQEHEGEGDATRVQAKTGFAGPGLFTTATGAHRTALRGFWLDCAGRTAAAHAATGKPDASGPPTSPDSWHRHADLLVTKPLTDAFTSTTGTEYTREGSFVDVLVIGGGFAWSGSDVTIDRVELRDSARPFKVAGGNCRIGMLKVFFSGASAPAITIDSSRCTAAVIEAQDAGADGVVLNGQDVLIGCLRVDTPGRLTGGDALVVNAARVHVAAASLIDRGVGALRPRTPIVLKSAKDCVIDATVSSGYTAGPVTGSMTGIGRVTVNGKAVA